MWNPSSKHDRFHVNGDYMYARFSRESIAYKHAARMLVFFLGGLRMAINVLETSVVKPLTPTKRHSLDLAGLELYWGAYGYARTLLFYKTQQDEFASIILRLKRSLSLLLEYFYPVAGRLVEDTIDCNDAGVEFVQACSDIDFSQLEADGFSVEDFFPALTPTGNWRMHPEDPILCVQVIIC